MKRYLPFVIVGIVAVATLTAGTILYRAKRPHLLTIPHAMVVGKGDTKAMHVRGNPDAEVTIEEFGDFQCPPCAGISAFLDEVVQENHPRVRLIFRNLPLPTHKYAYDASLAAEAAGSQNKFWEMHDVLYQEQNVWSKADNVTELFRAYAGMIGLKLDQFKNDMAGDQAKARVEADKERASSLGVKSTPTLFIDNQEVGPNDRNPGGVRRLVREALKPKEATPPEGATPAATTPTPAVSPTPATSTPTVTPASPTPTPKAKRPRTRKRK